MTEETRRKIMAENLLYYMKLNNYSRKDISRKTGAAYTTVTDWVHGKTFPRPDKMKKLTSIFNCSEADLIEENDHIYLPPSTIENSFKILPEMGEVACGQPETAEEIYENATIVPGDVRADFTLICHGSSMTGVGLHDGDRVYIRRQDQVNDGEIAAVLINEEATLKLFYYYPEENMVILRAANPNYKDQIYRGEKLDEIRVIGKAVGASIKL